MTDRAGSLRLYWHRTLLVTCVLVALWLTLTAAVGLWAPDQQFSFFGWPFGYWAAAQGAMVAYCAIVWAYALLMERIEAAHADPSLD